MNYICKICGRNFSKINSLSRHITVKHKDITSEKYYLKHINGGNKDNCCHNVNCNNKTNFIGFIKGYHLYCSRKCLSSSNMTKAWNNPNNIASFEKRNISISNRMKILQRDKEFSVKRDIRLKDSLLQLHNFRKNNGGFSPSELTVKLELERRGIDFCAQDSRFLKNLGGRIGLIGLVMDFSFPRHKLDLEVDGKFGHSVMFDFIRDKILWKRGWKVLRISNEEVNRNVTDIIDRVIKTIQDKTWEGTIRL